MILLFRNDEEKEIMTKAVGMKLIATANLIIIANKDGTGIIKKNRYTQLQGPATNEQVNDLIRMDIGPSV